jgi:hypothetical protein
MDSLEDAAKAQFAVGQRAAAAGGVLGRAGAPASRLRAGSCVHTDSAYPRPPPAARPAPASARRARRCSRRAARARPSSACATASSRARRRCGPAARAAPSRETCRPARAAARRASSSSRCVARARGVAGGRLRHAPLRPSRQDPQTPAQATSPTPTPTPTPTPPPAPHPFRSCHSSSTFWGRTTRTPTRPTGGGPRRTGGPQRTRVWPPRRRAARADSPPARSPPPCPLPPLPQGRHRGLQLPRQLRRGVSPGTRRLGIRRGVRVGAALALSAPAGAAADAAGGCIPRTERPARTGRGGGRGAARRGAARRGAGCCDTHALPPRVKRSSERPSRHNPRAPEKVDDRFAFTD